MKVIEKDILTVESGIICQQVNCQGKMNSGLAKQIREKWPVVFDRYITFCNYKKNDFELLGEILPVYVKGTTDSSLIICNVFGQLNYGYDGKRYTDYGALNNAFKNIIEYKDSWFAEEKDIYFPFNFGACRGGGSWEIISNMIEYYFPNAIICKYP